MIYITGDTHGRFKKIKMFCRENNTSKDDIMIILGDVGINYFLDERDEQIKGHLESLPVTIFCIHGNHEARPGSIKTYKKEVWKGGTVYREEKYPSILFAKDGEVFDLSGKKSIVLGGAYSVDKFYRLSRGMNWFSDEQPSDEIIEFVEAQLELYDYKMEVVLSHTCPLRYEPIEVFLPGIDQSTVDKATEKWLGRIEEVLDYEEWYCGHYHTDKRIDKMRFLMDDIIEF